MNQRGDTVVLHVSDLHRAPGEELSNDDLWGSLRNDIENGFPITNRSLLAGEPHLPNKEEIDSIVVSGDLTQRAGDEEYLEVEQFLDHLAGEYLSGNRDRMIVVPGNHDIDWDLSRASYRDTAFDRTSFQQAGRHESTYRLEQSPDSPNRTLKRRLREDLYAQRLEAFANFFSRFYSKAHPLPLRDRSQHFAIFDGMVGSTGLVFVGFSSCDLVDHLWRRGTINRNAILKASEELDRRGYHRDTCFRIAVWHHNLLGSPDQPDFMDPTTALLLATNGFRLGLHGHVHQTGRLEFLGADARLPVVWAGSLCAGARERPQSTPMLYNVIGINAKDKRGWVHVRTRPDEHLAWSAFSEWGEGHRCWYPLELADGAGVDSLESYGISNLARSMTDGIGSTRSILETVTHTFAFMGIAAQKWIHTAPLLEQVLNRISARTTPMKFLLLDPTSDYARSLSNTQHGNETHVRDEICESLREFNRLRKLGYKLDVHLYSMLPIFRIALVDNATAYVGFYRSGTKGTDSPQLVLRRIDGPTFLQPFDEYFEDVWNNHSNSPDWDSL